MHQPQHDSLQASPPAKLGGAYAWYVLIVLMIVYAVNFIDRQIITILAGDLKRDLGLADTEIGLLYGTAFALFYALFGIPLGKLADTWVRTRMMALGLAVWSAMTALSGFAGNFVQLAGARVGVGIGEASASPAAYSLLSDYFPKEKRATALAIYTSGIYVGAGLSLVLGGFIVYQWEAAFAAAASAPFGLKGWQVAFLAVGAPGLLLALLVATLREPQRGAADGVLQPQEARPFAKTWTEFTAIVPPFTFMHLRAIKASRREWGLNLLAGLLILGVAEALVIFANGAVPDEKRKVVFDLGSAQITSHTIQWAALGLGAYGVFSWAQSLRIRDRPSYALIWQTPTVTALIIVGGLISLASYGIGAFIPYYATITFGISLKEAGLALGLTAATGGWLGTTLGGVLGDAWRLRHPLGRLYLALIAVLAPLPLVAILFTTHTLSVFYSVFFLVNLAITLWLGCVATTCQDLVLPRMRGTTAAAFFLGTTLLGLGVGPYMVGFVSDVTGNLKIGILSVYIFLPITLGCLILAIRTLELAETSRLERARAAGETI